MRKIYYPSDKGGCSWWRMRMPCIEEDQDILHRIINNVEFYDTVDEVIIQRQIDPRLIDLIRDTKNTKWIYDIDDVVFYEDVPLYNNSLDDFKDGFGEKAVAIMNECHEVRCSTVELADYYQPKTTTICTVRPNESARFWFSALRDYDRNMEYYNKYKKRPRVLWSGSASHLDVFGKGQDDDFSHVLGTIAKLAKDFQFVFLGECPYALRRLVDRGYAEFYPWVPIAHYPEFLSKLEINFAFAPLKDNLFNKCKSNIKFLESAYLGIPCIAQDMVTYKDAFLKFKNGDDLAKQLYSLRDDRKKYEKQVKLHLDYAEDHYLIV